ncbi:hypothetical protein BASA60_003976 [Batrachochytrium salamandrivorans]|nr:hypothetical protein BASA60_003976 [Batrachochytrium salamandrivorans]
MDLTNHQMWVSSDSKQSHYKGKANPYPDLADFRKKYAGMTDEQFSLGLARIFNKMRDRHALYYKAGPYGCFSVTTGLFFNFVDDSLGLPAPPKVRVVGITNTPEILGLIGNVLSTVAVGDELLTVNGVPFNDKLWGDSNILPEDDSITFQLKRLRGNQELYTVTIPYVSLSDDECWDLSSSLYEELNSIPPHEIPASTSVIQKRSVSGNGTSLLGNSTLQKGDADIYKRSYWESVNFEDTNIDGLTWTIWKNGERNMGVISIESFSPVLKGTGEDTTFLFLILTIRELLVDQLKDTDAILFDIRDISSTSSYHPSSPLSTSSSIYIPASPVPQPALLPTSATLTQTQLTHPIQLHGINLPSVSQYEYLGVIIDDLLTLFPWLAKKKRAITAAAHSISPLLRNNFLSTRYRLTIFNGLVLGVAYYGLELIGGNSTLARRLQAPVNTGIRMILKAPLFTPIAPMLTDCGIISLDAHAILARVRLTVKATTLKTPLQTLLLPSTIPSHSNSWFWTRRSRSLIRFVHPNIITTTSTTIPSTPTISEIRRQRSKYAFERTFQVWGKSKLACSYVQANHASSAKFLRSPALSTGQAIGVSLLSLARCGGLWDYPRALKAASPSLSTATINSNPDPIGASAIWDSVNTHTPIDNYQYSLRTTPEFTPSSSSSPSGFPIFSFFQFSPHTRFEPPISVAHSEIPRQVQDTVEENPTASRTTTTDTHTAAISSTPTPTHISHIGSDDILTVLLGGSLPGTNTAGNTEAYPGQQWLTGSKSPWSKAWSATSDTSRYSGFGSMEDSSIFNTFGQVYFNPVGVYTDGMCYSTCETFAAHIQDHGIGTVFGEDETTGGSGADVLSSDDDDFTNRPLEYIADPFTKRLTGENSGQKFYTRVTVSVRQLVRSGKYVGQLVEDNGVKSDVIVRPTIGDILPGDRGVSAYDRIADYLNDVAKRKVDSKIYFISEPYDRVTFDDSMNIPFVASGVDEIIVVHQGLHNHLITFIEKKQGKAGFQDIQRNTRVSTPNDQVNMMTAKSYTVAGPSSSVGVYNFGSTSEQKGWNFNDGKWIIGDGVSDYCGHMSSTVRLWLFAPVGSTIGISLDGIVDTYEDGWYFGLTVMDDSGEIVPMVSSTSEDESTQSKSITGRSRVIDETHSFTVTTEEFSLNMNFVSYGTNSPFSVKLNSIVITKD